MATDPIIQEIKEKIDIVEMIGEYLPVKRAGTNFKANCPFHNEKTPSFMISRDRGFWHCFGCGESGDVFAFLQKHEGLSFPEVLKILAERTGVRLPEKRDLVQVDREAKQRDDLVSINELAAKFYHQSLLRSQSGKIARDYLTKRGLNDETIKKWQIGFAPDDWHILENFLKTRGISQSLALSSGLLVRGEKGKIYDRFRFRVMFPFFDQFGRVVGFTGRTLDSSDQAKYVNSPESIVYHKGKLLFGYYFAKKAIRTEDRAVIVEGNIDCISSYQAGVENVVASSGTALTSDQLNILKRLTSNLVFALDADKAGLIAMRKALEPALALGFNIYIADLQGKKDPDELIQVDLKAWKASVGSAVYFLDYIYNLIFKDVKPSDLEGSRKAAKDYLAVVKLVSDPIARAQEAKRVSERLNVPIEPILEFLGKAPTTAKSEQKNAAKPKVGVRNRVEKLVEKILALALVNVEFAESIKKQFRASDFSTLAPIFPYVIKSIPEDSKYSDQLALLRFVGEEEWRRLKEEYTEEQKLIEQFEYMCAGLKELNLQEEMRLLTSELADKERMGDKQAVKDLRLKFRELSNQLSQIKRIS